MRFHAALLQGAWVIELDRLGDERGWFARSFDAKEFLALGLNPNVVQCNMSFNAQRDTVRGMHYQADPHAESKLVRCVRGAIFDVAVDLRPNSPTYCRWHGVELNAESANAFYIPEGLAHGFQTLVDDCEVVYQMGHCYVPDAARGVRWDDPAFGIEWPPTALAEAGHEVHAIARRRGSDTPGVTWHEADLLDGPDVLGEVRPEVLVHLAWYTEHGKFWTAMDNVRWVEASLALLRAFAASGGRRAVMAGTCAEYEWSRKIYTEVAPKRPTTLYGTAKHGLHVLASAIAAQAGFSLAWGRLFFLYGPQESPERFVPSLVMPMLLG